MSLSAKFVEVGVDAGVGGEIPECKASDLIVVAPIEIHLVDHRLSALVFAELRVVEIERGYLSYQECLKVGVVAGSRDSVGTL